MFPELLSQLGTGLMDSVPYDTAWLARLAPQYREFGSALEWLRSRQHADGSWGSPMIYYHDRVVNTLSAVLALHDNGSAEDRLRAEQGIAYLWREYARISSDPHDTVGYSVLVTSMLHEAAQRGIHVPQYLGNNPQEVTAKLKLVAGAPRTWRQNSMSFSVEALRDQLPGELEFLEANGSAAASPAATAAVLSRFNYRPAYDYLRQLVAKQGDGGVPNADPIDIFEISWALNYIRLTGVDPADPIIQAKLDVLERAWNAERGSTFSTYFSAHDLDITSVVLTVLAWGGRSVDASAIGYFELPNSFRTYIHEVHPSLSVHLDLLVGLQTAGFDRDHPWMVKALGQVMRWKDQGVMWFDKWHISPYYLSLSFTEALMEYDHEIVAERVRWIMATQRPNGGWGHFHATTAEETAYALLILMRWARRYDGVPAEVIDRGIGYLAEVANDTDLPPLWICKCLYSPRLIVQSAVASALHLYESGGRRHKARRGMRQDAMAKRSAAAAD